MCKNNNRKNFTIINNFSNKTIKSNLKNIRTKEIIILRKCYKKLQIYKKTISNSNRKK